MYGKTISLNHWKIYVAFSCLLLNLYLHVKVVFKSLQRQDFFYWFYCSVHWTQIVMQGTVAFKGSYPKLAIGSWIYLHAPNFWGCSGSATFANLSIRSYAPLLSKCRIYALLSSNRLQQLVNIYPKSNHSLPKMVIYALFTSKCRESHLRAFVVKSTRVPGLGKGGEVKPMPGFSRQL